MGSCMRLPERIAAAVVVCGKSEEKYAELAKDVPLWVVHGDADTVIPVDCSRSMVAAVKEAGGNPKYTELPGVGHDSWTAAYHDEKLLDWFSDSTARESGRNKTSVCCPTFGSVERTESDHLEE